MVSVAEIQSGVIECVTESLAQDPGSVTLHSSLIRDLGADSLDFLDIMFSLESRFGVKLEKEDFNLLSKLKMPREEAIVDDALTPIALERLKQWLPSLPQEGKIAVSALGSYITIETLVIIVQEFKARAS